MLELLLRWLLLLWLIVLILQSVKDKLKQTFLLLFFVFVRVNVGLTVDVHLCQCKYTNKNVCQYQSLCVHVCRKPVLILFILQIRLWALLSEKATYGDLQSRSQFREISLQFMSFASYGRHEVGLGKGGFLRQKKIMICVGPLFIDLVCEGENGNMVRLSSVCS